MKLCENCSSLINKNYGSGRFCSANCARGFSTKSKRQIINKTVSEALTKKPYKRTCLFCKNKFKTKKQKQKLCSKKCQGKYKSPKMKVNMSKSVRKRIKNGTHQGWQSRKIRSYAEKFFETVLNENGIKCNIEHKINKRLLGFKDSSNYFLDFFFPEINLDLEIDGKQHNYKDRIKSDKTRDIALNKYGIEVYRIKWKNPNTQINKKYIKGEIDKFLEFHERRKTEIQTNSTAV